MDAQSSDECWAEIHMQDNKTTCVWKEISCRQTQVIWRKQKKYDPCGYFSGNAFESIVSLSFIGNYCGIL